ncbi:hypothetical protein C9374_011855 [Naegleria lovaniensis]|uniref:Uncharacterized protein n=1 Tax=Naegleria lovaniensis TaxID=51637 RepID=A0AA88GC61_NAELO|nr:uncharacterized protein C9374_011855 [Naegleria lovaniensis]KAG2373766.1 hypothetical protein C9374_011855 [Naegleria lovaniensis]
MGQGNSSQISHYEESQAITKIFDGFSTLLRLQIKEQDRAIEKISSRLDQLEKSVFNIQQDLNVLKSTRPVTSHSSFGSNSQQQFSTSGYGIVNPSLNSQVNTTNFSPQYRVIYPVQNNVSHHSSTSSHFPAFSQSSSTNKTPPVAPPPEVLGTVTFVYNNDYEPDLLTMSVKKFADEMKTCFGSKGIHFATKSEIKEGGKKYVNVSFMDQSSFCSGIHPSSASGKELVIFVCIRKSDSRETRLDMTKLFPEISEWMASTNHTKNNVTDGTGYLFVKFQNYKSVQEAGNSEYQELTPFQELEIANKEHFTSCAMGYFEVPFSFLKKDLLVYSVPHTFQTAVHSFFITNK